MLTEKQYAAIGRMALAFNGVEAVIDSMCPQFISGPEVSIVIAAFDKDSTFSRKLERFKRILTAFIKHFQPLGPDTPISQQNPLRPSRL